MGEAESWREARFNSGHSDWSISTTLPNLTATPNSKSTFSQLHSQTFLQLTRWIGSPAVSYTTTVRYKLHLEVWLVMPSKSVPETPQLWYMYMRAEYCFVDRPCSKIGQQAFPRVLSSVVHGLNYSLSLSLCVCVFVIPCSQNQPNMR